MNRYYLPAIFVSSLFILGCGGGGSTGSSAGTDSGTGSSNSYNPYEGIGFRGTRLKVITTNGIDVEIFKYTSVTPSGNLLSINKSFGGGGSRKQTFEYNEPGYKLSKITAISEKPNGDTSTEEYSLTYGTIIFLPTNSPIVAKTNQILSLSNGNSSISESMPVS